MNNGPFRLTLSFVCIGAMALIAPTSTHGTDDPRDPLFSKQRSLFEQLGVLEAWEHTKGSTNIVIGVLDQGFDHYHPDLRANLQPQAAVGIQCTSPLFSRKAYWCIINTMQSSGFHVCPYHVPIPSFGIWGFALAGPIALEPPVECPDGLRYLNRQTLATLFQFPPDIDRLDTKVNRLDNQVLVHYYDQDWTQQLP